jgi:adenylate cyclase class 2
LTGPVETEVKVRVADVESARKAVARIGARRLRERHHESNVLFDFADGRLRRAGSVVRLRSAGGENVVTFKGPKTVLGGVRSREEIETSVADGRLLALLFDRLGLVPTFRYEKYREVWEWSGQKVLIDETPIGVFVEIEGDEAGIRSTAKALGFGESEFVPDTYVGLFLAGGGQGDMVFR